MDFWASLEHKIYYKYNKEIPEKLSQELKEAADSAADLDRKMETIHKEVSAIKELAMDDESISQIQVNEKQFRLPFDLLRAVTN